MKGCYFKNRSFKIATMIQLSRVILKNCCVGYFVAVATICFKKWLFFLWLPWFRDWYGWHPFQSICWGVLFFLYICCDADLLSKRKGLLLGKNAASSARRVVTCLLASWFNVKCLDLKQGRKKFHSGNIVFFGDSGIFWHNPGTQNYCVTSQANWICNLLLWWVTTAYYYNRHRYMIYKCTVYK